MRGINRNNGKALEGIDHLRQSIKDILTTPIGSRVMRRDYGSRLFDLIDAPLNGSTFIDLYAATADALQKWETRIQILDIKISRVAEGQVYLDLTGVYTPTGEVVNLDRIQIK